MLENRNEEREGTTRPILVSLASASSVQQLLYRAKELRDWDKYGRVFLGPDRSIGRSKLTGKDW